MHKFVSFRSRTALILILLLAFLLRLETLAQNPLWFDESMEFWVATAPLVELFSIVKHALQDPPFYSLLLHFWMNLGRDEFTLRLFSTFVSLLSIATIFALGKYAHSELAGSVAALILAILPPDIRFAQEVGQYALLIFSVLMNLLIMSYARQTNRWPYWIAWVITALLSAYNYYGSLLIILTVAACVLLENIIKGKRKYFVRQATASLVFLVLVLPLIIYWLPIQLFRGPTANAFQFTFAPLAAEMTTFIATTKQLLAYQLTGYISDPIWANLQLVAWVLILLSLSCCLLGLIKHPRYAYLVIWLLAGWLVYYAVGRLGIYPYGGSRHTLILTPLLVLCVSVGIATLWASKPALGGIMLMSLTAVALLSPREAPEDLRAVLYEYLANREDQAPTYVYYGAVPGFRYQLQLIDNSKGMVPADWYGHCWAGTSEQYCAEDSIFYGEWIRSLSPEEKYDEILSTLGTTSEAGFWLIFSHTDALEQDEVVSIFREKHAIADSIEVVGASAYLFRQP